MVTVLGILYKARAHEQRRQGSPLERVDLHDQVLVTLERMLDEERQVLEWKYLEELAVAAMAERLGRTEKAVEALLYRARRSFRELTKNNTFPTE